MIIEAQNLSFAYPGSADSVFEGLSFRVDTDWRLGLVGRNGRGKTTLLRILAGELEPSGNLLGVRGGADYFPYPDPPEGSTALEAAENARPDLEQWRLEMELSKLGADPSELLWRDFYTLSNGERTKVMLAALFACEGRFLLIDEPTNHLDASAREQVAEYLRQKSGFLLVSHDRAFLDACTDHILALDRNSAEVVRGNYSVWREQRDRREQFERATNERLGREVRRLDAAAELASRRADAADRSKYKKSNKNAALHEDVSRGHVGKMAARSASKAKALERRVGSAAAEKRELLETATHLRRDEAVEELKLSPRSDIRRALLSSGGLSIAYDPSRPVFEGLRFELQPGDRTAIVGKNGTGKSSLLKLILGEEIPHNGELFRASGMVMSYVPQDSSFLRGSARDYAAECGVEDTLMLAILRKLGFKREQFTKDMRDWSAGQRKKVLLARSLCESAHLYVWDEPLNFIDLESREQIEQLILNFKPTMLFVEHDRRFCENVCTQAIEL